MHRGIDVSVYQGVIDWQEVKMAGIEYAIIRAGYGRYAKQKDKYFVRNVEGAKVAGIKIGAYWFGYAVDKVTAKQEAEMCADIIQGIDFDLPIFYDYEYDSFRAAESKGITIDKTLASDIVITFLDTLAAKGYTVANYCNPDLIKYRFDDRISKYDTWIADYEDGIDITIPYVVEGFKVIGWQYSFKGQLPGIQGNVDMDVFYDVEELQPEPVETLEIVAGNKVELNNTPCYSSETIATSYGKKTGTYYLWDDTVKNNRIRITNAASRVGVKGQVTCWVDITDINLKKDIEEYKDKLYTVCKGDGFWTIAKKHSSTDKNIKKYAEQIATHNGLNINSTIHSGQVLKIPKQQ